MKFRTFVILDVDVDPKSVAQGATAACVAAELAREALAQQHYAIEIHQVDGVTGAVWASAPFVSLPAVPLESRRVTDRIDARRRIPANANAADK